MSLRSYAFWVSSLILLGVVILGIYFLAINRTTLRIGTEASNAVTARLALPRSGVIQGYDPTTDQLTFIEDELSGSAVVLVDETTTIRQVVDNTYVDADLEALQPGRILTITLDGPTPNVAIGALDISEAQQ